MRIVNCGFSRQVGSESEDVAVQGFPPGCIDCGFSGEGRGRPGDPNGEFLREGNRNPPGRVDKSRCPASTD